MVEEHQNELVTDELVDTHGGETFGRVESEIVVVGEDIEVFEQRSVTEDVSGL